LLKGANLQNADLTGVNLSNADLTDADLTDAEMGSILLEGANICGTKFNASTPPKSCS
jgi:uncharacterized protein YjbI with pentapeptide repeats